MDLLRSAVLIWTGCCLRNKEDRDLTFKFINTIGNQIEKSIIGSKPVDKFGEEDENFR